MSSNGAPGPLKLRCLKAKELDWVPGPANRHKPELVTMYPKELAA